MKEENLESVALELKSAGLREVQLEVVDEYEQKDMPIGGGWGCPTYGNYTQRVHNLEYFIIAQTQKSEMKIPLFKDRIDEFNLKTDGRSNLLFLSFYVDRIRNQGIEVYNGDAPFDRRKEAEKILMLDVISLEYSKKEEGIKNSRVKWCRVNKPNLINSLNYFWNKEILERPPLEVFVKMARKENLPINIETEVLDKRRYGSSYPTINRILGYEFEGLIKISTQNELIEYVTQLTSVSFLCPLSEQIDYFKEITHINTLRDALEIMEKLQRYDMKEPLWGGEQFDKHKIEESIINRDKQKGDILFRDNP